MNNDGLDLRGSMLAPRNYGIITTPTQVELKAAESSTEARERALEELNQEDERAKALLEQEEATVPKQEEVQPNEAFLRHDSDAAQQAVRMGQISPNDVMMADSIAEMARMTKGQEQREIDKQFVHDLLNLDPEDAEGKMDLCDRWVTTRISDVHNRGNILNNMKPFENADAYADSILAFMRNGWHGVSSERFRTVQELLGVDDREGLIKLLNVPLYKDPVTGDRCATETTRGHLYSYPNDKRPDTEIEAELADKVSDVMAEQKWLVYKTMESDLSPRGKQIVDKVIQNGEFDTADTEVFKAIMRTSPDEGAKIHYLVQMFRPSEKDLWGDTMDQTGRLALDMFKNAWRVLKGTPFGYFDGLAVRTRYERLYSEMGYTGDELTAKVDAAVAQAKADDLKLQHQRAEERHGEILLSDLTHRKQYENYDWLGRSFEGMFSTLPYMAITAIPYVGMVINVASHFQDVEDEIVREGGDVATGRFARLISAGVWAGIEKLQYEGFVKTLSPIEKRMLWKRLTAEGWKKCLPNIGNIAKGYLTEMGVKTVFETAQEGLQDGLEEVEKDVGFLNDLDPKKRKEAHDLINDFLSGFANGLYESVGSMGGLAFFGSALGTSRAMWNQRQAFLDQESIKAFINRENVVDSMIDGTVADTREPKAKAAHRQKVLNKIIELWTAPNTGDAIKDRETALGDIQDAFHFSTDMMQKIADYLDMRQEMMQSIARATGTEMGPQGEMFLRLMGLSHGFRIGNDTTYDVVDVMKLLNPNIEVEEVEVEDTSREATEAPKSARQAELEDEIARAEEAIAAGRTTSQSKKKRQQKKAQQRDAERLADLKRELAEEIARRPAPTKPTKKLQRLTIPMVDKDGNTVKKSVIIEEIDGRLSAQSIASDGFASSLADECGRAGIEMGGILVKDEATKKQGMEWWKNFLAKDPENARRWLDINDFHDAGNFTRQTRVIDEKTGKVLMTTDGIIRLLRKTNDVMRRKGNKTLIHEYAHAVVRFARQLGLFDDPQTVETFKQLFGEAKVTGNADAEDNELFDEESLADALAQFMREEYDFGKISREVEVKGWLNKLFNLFGGHVKAEISLRKKAQMAVFNAIRQGDFAGLSPFAGIKFTGEKTEAGARDAEREKRKRETEESAAGEEEREESAADKEEKTETSEDEAEAETGEKSGEEPAAEGGEAGEGATPPPPIGTPRAKKESPLARKKRTVKKDIPENDFDESEWVKKSDHEAEVARLQASLEEAKRKAAAGEVIDVPTRDMSAPHVVHSPITWIPLKVQWAWMPRADVTPAGAGSSIQERFRSLNTASQTLLRDRAARGKFVPERLTADNVGDRGAPIVVGGNICLSGNGRMMLLNMVAERGGYNEYLNAVRKWCRENGVIDCPAELLDKEPVLVQRVVECEDTDTINKFAMECNRSDHEELTTSEKAKAGVKAITPALMRFYNVPASGDMMSKSNWDFIAQFYKALGESVPRTMEGEIEPEAGLRIERAFLAKILGGEESDDEKYQKDVFSLINTILAGGDGLAVLRNALIRNGSELYALLGNRSSYNILKEIRVAVKKYVGWRAAQASGATMSLATYANSLDMFEQTSALQAAITSLLDTNYFNAILKKYNELAQKENQDGQDMLGGLGVEKRTRGQLLALAERAVVAKDEKTGEPVTPYVTRDPSDACWKEAEQTPPAVTAGKPEPIKNPEAKSAAPVTPTPTPVTPTPTPTVTSETPQAPVTPAQPVKSVIKPEENEALDAAESVLTTEERTPFIPVPAVKGTVTIPNPRDKGKSRAFDYEDKENGVIVGKKTLKDIGPGVWDNLRDPYDFKKGTVPVSEQDRAGRGIWSGNLRAPIPQKNKMLLARYGGKCPHYMGNKNDMTERTVGTICEKMSPSEREHYTSLVDCFGGGGCWGLTLALTCFPNANNLIINEFEADRVTKIRLLQTHGEKLGEECRAVIARHPEIFANLTEKDKKNIANFRDKFLVECEKVAFTSEERGMVQAIYDVMASTVGVFGKQDKATGAFSYEAQMEDAYKTIAKDARQATELAQAYAARGGHITYVCGDAKQVETFGARIGADGTVSQWNETGEEFRVPHGDNVMKVCDPPYYRTTGYDLDRETGEKSNTEVGFESEKFGWGYQDTEEMLKSLVDFGDGICYTDEAWFYKNGFGKKKDKSNGQQGFSNFDSEQDFADLWEKEQKVLCGIINEFDHFDVAGMVASRYETLGVHHGHNNNEGTERVADARGSRVENASRTADAGLHGRGSLERDERDVGSVDTHTAGENEAVVRGPDSEGGRGSGADGAGGRDASKRGDAVGAGDGAGAAARDGQAERANREADKSLAREGCVQTIERAIEEAGGERGADTDAVVRHALASVADAEKANLARELLEYVRTGKMSAKANYPEALAVVARDLPIAQKVDAMRRDLPDLDRRQAEAIVLDGMMEQTRHSIRTNREARWRNLFSKAEIKAVKAKLARRMKKAGYTEHVWHGTVGEDFNVFEASDDSHEVPAVYLSYQRGTAENYAYLRSQMENFDFEYDPNTANIRDFYVNPGRVYEYDEAKEQLDYEAFVALVKKVYDEGYDSMRCIGLLDDHGHRLGAKDAHPHKDKRAKDNGPMDAPLPTDVLIVFDRDESPAANRIKAADPFTFEGYDENVWDNRDKVIPISERANPNNPDVRYSISHIYTGSGAEYEKPSLDFAGNESLYGKGIYGSGSQDEAKSYGLHQLLEQTFFTNRPEGDTTHLLFTLKELSPLIKKNIKAQIKKQGLDAKAIDDFIRLYQTRGEDKHPINAEHPLDVAIGRDIIFGLRRFFVDKAEKELKRKEGEGRIQHRERINAAAEDAFREFLVSADVDGYVFPNDQNYSVDYQEHDGVIEPSEQNRTSQYDPSRYEKDYRFANFVSFRDDNIRIDHKWMNGEQRYSIASARETELTEENKKRFSIIAGSRTADYRGKDLDAPNEGARRLKHRFATLTKAWEMYDEIMAQRKGKGTRKGKKTAAANDTLLTNEENRRVWLETGWWQGVDGEWRIELANPDPKRFCKKPPTKMMSRRLDEVIEQDDLFEVYPELRNVIVTFDPQNKVLAYADINNLAITILYKEAVGKNGNLSSRGMESLTHEIQHIVQYLEGRTDGFAHYVLPTEGDSERTRFKKWYSYLRDEQEAEAYVGQFRSIYSGRFYTGDGPQSIATLNAINNPYATAADRAKALSPMEARKEHLRDAGPRAQYFAGLPLTTPRGVQKQAGVNYPDAADEIAQVEQDVRFSIGSKKAAEYRALIARKRPDLDAAEIDATMGEIAKFETPKAQKAALHWYVKGRLRLPEDAPKVTQALEYAEKAKADPMQFAGPVELMEALHEFKPKAKPIDPDTVPYLSDKQNMGHGVTTYLVDESRESQQAMREIINTHWGEDANPWCLLQGDGHGNLSDGTNSEYDARKYWEYYSALPKRVAFKNGKLLAFMATDGSDTEFKYPPTRQGWDDYVRDYLLPKYEEAYKEWVTTNNAYDKFDEWMQEFHPDEFASARAEVFGQKLPEEWWDRVDEKHKNIPIANMPIPNDPFGRWANYELLKDGVIARARGYKKGGIGQNGFREWGYDKYKYFLRQARDNDIVRRWSEDESLSGHLSSYVDIKKNRGFTVRLSRDTKPYVSRVAGVTKDNKRLILEFSSNGLLLSGTYPHNEEEQNLYAQIREWKKEADRILAEEEANNPNYKANGERYSIASMPWRTDETFPKIVAQTSLPSINEKYADLHAAGKRGDLFAALSLVRATYKPGKLAPLAQAHPNAIVVPVVAEERTGRNAIPKALALMLSDEYGWSCEDRIKQSVRAYHTGMERAERLFTAPEFVGNVEKGREYILIDDHVTTGSTLNALRSFIEENGGKVVACSALTLSRGCSIICPRKDTLDAVRRKHTGIDQLLRRAGVAASAECLTDRQLGDLKTLSSNTLRARFAGRMVAPSERGAVANDTEGQAESEAAQASVLTPTRYQHMDYHREDEWRDEADEATRHVLARGPHSAKDGLTAYIASQILAGKKVTTETVDTDAKNLGMRNVNAADLLVDATNLANKNREKARAKVAAADPSLFDDLKDEAMRLRVNQDLDNALTQGAAINDPFIGKKYAEAAARHAKRSLDQAKGFTAKQLMAECPIDPVAALFAVAEYEKSPAVKARLEKAKAKRKEREEDIREAAEKAGMSVEEFLEAQEAEGKEGYTAPSAEDVAYFNELMDRAKARRELQQAAEAELERKRKEREEKKKAAAESAADGEEAGGASEASEGGDVSGRDAAEIAPDEEVPFATIERIAPVFADAETFALFLTEWCADKVVSRHPEIPATAQMWRNPIAVKELINTAQDILSYLARNALGTPQVNAARNYADRGIIQLAHRKTYKSVLRGITQVYDAIHTNALKMSRRQLIKNLIREGNALTGVHTGDRFSSTKEAKDRKTIGATELWWRFLKPYLTMSEAKLEAERVRLEAIVTNYNQESAEYGYTAANFLEYRDACDKLALIGRFGGLIRKMPNEIREAVDEILTELRGKREAFEAERAAEEQENATLRNAILKAVEAGGTEAYRKQKGPLGRWVSRMGTEMNGILTLELQNLIRYCRDEGLRQRALDAIQELVIMVGRASEKYRVTLGQANAECNQAIKDIYGSGDAALRHLTEETIPEEIARQIFTQSRDKLPTYGQLLQLYASCLQAGYHNNVLLHHRAETLELMEKTLTKEDLAFHAWAIEWYAQNRASISDECEAITGLGIASPDRFYVPVRILNERDGLPTEALAWTPVPKALSRRVRHGLDFDENANFLTMVGEQCEIRAQLIGYGKLGIRLRDIIAHHDLQKAVARNVSRADMAAVTTHIRDILVQGVERKASDAVMRPLNVSRGWLALFYLSGNVMSAFKQLASVPVWANTVGFKNVNKYLVTAFTPEGIERIKELIATDGFRARYIMGWSEETQNLLRRPTKKTILPLLKKGLQKGMIVNKGMDMVGCLWMAQGFYADAKRAMLDKGWSEEEARQRAAALTWSICESGQQSGRVENLNKLQRRWGEFGGAVFQFMTAYLQQNAYEIQAFKDFAAKTPGASGRLARALIINHLLIPGIVELVNIAWRALMGEQPLPDDPDDWEEWLKGFAFECLFGVLAPMFFIKQIALTMWNKATQRKGQYRYETVMPVEGVFKIIGDAGEVVIDITDVCTAEDWEKEVTVEKLQKDLLKFIGDIAAPVKHATRAYRNWSNKDE